MHGIPTWAYLLLLAVHYWPATLAIIIAVAVAAWRLFRR